MNRRNPAAASSPNPQFEMTSFMDIIFIFLFVVMIGSALKSAGVSAAANEKMAEADAKLAEADKKLQEADNKLADIAPYEQLIEDLQGAVVGSRVQIVTLTCTYEADSTKRPQEWMRHLRVLGSDGKMLIERDFAENASQPTFEKLAEVLKEYMERVKKVDREALGERYETAKKEHTIVVFSVSMEDGGILTKDYEAIAGIIEELERAYDDVY